MPAVYKGLEQRVRRIFTCMLRCALRATQKGTMSTVCVVWSRWLNLLPRSRVWLGGCATLKEGTFSTTDSYKEPILSAYVCISKKKTCCGYTKNLCVVVDSKKGLWIWNM